MSSSPLSNPPSPPTASSEDADNNLQPFFVLHKGSHPKSERKSSGPRKTRRKIDLPPSSPKTASKSDEPPSQEASDATYDQIRLEAFNLTWSKIDTAIKEVLKKTNINLFNEVHRWVSESFSTVKSVKQLSISDIQRPFPTITDATCKQIPTALIFTKNAEFVDDLLTFQELGEHLRSNGCHVASLSALDFSSKHGIGSCLRSLLRQLVTEALDVADIAILASWYCEQENYDRPVIVIIDDLERCDGGTLSEFIRMLSEWALKIPIIFIMGVATTVDAPRKLLLSNALQCLQPFKFTLGSPIEKMNALIEGVLIKTCSGLIIGHKVAVFLRNYFLRHDGTITSFIRALKIACIKHFSVEPLSFLSLGMLDDDCESFWRDKCEALPITIIQCAFDHPSCQREKGLRCTHDHLVRGLCELRRAQKNWSSVVMCLFEVGKLNKMQLLDILCEAADPSLHSLRTSAQKSQMPSESDNKVFGGKFGSAKGGFIAQAIHNVRELSVTSLLRLLSTWSIHTEEMHEVHGKVKELQTVLGSVDASQILRESRTEICRRSRSLGSEDGDKAAILLDGMVRNFLTPIESLPFHEIICFKNVDVLKSALIGDPRRTVQVDLLKAQSYLQCTCCGRGENSLLPSMHDTSIMYNLAQEYGDLINLHDWYQSFKQIILSSHAKNKHKVLRSPSSQKAKATPHESEAAIQARFCRAVAELQITGLLRMPSKRRPDFVQRVAFGI